MILYKSCSNYTYGEQQVYTPYIAKALGEFFRPDQITVLVTTEAKTAHWESLQEELGGLCPVNDVLIPSGKTEAEIWQIFDVVVNTVPANSEVIFDITHAFRSIPLLVLLAAAFLQKARGVKIAGVYYGAFEAKIQGDFYRQKQRDREIQPQLLQKFGDRIQGLASAIELIRPFDILTEAAALQNIPTNQLETEVGTFAKPFEILLTQIQEDYGQFALDLKTSTPVEQLQKQFLLLRWYVEKKLSAQGILLGREWFISAFCVVEGINDYQERENRREIELQLNRMIGPEANLDQAIARHVSNPQELSAFWSLVIERRNDLAHTQMRSTSVGARVLQRFVEQDLLDKLAYFFPTFTVTTQ